MSNLEEIQKEMFEKEDLMIEMAEVFGALALDHEIFFFEHFFLYFSKMYSAGILQKRRSWREVEYALNTEDPFVQGIVSLLSIYLKK